jgi:hypothetical protein
MSETALNRFRLRRDAALARNQALFAYHRKRTRPTLARVLDHSGLAALDYDLFCRITGCVVEACGLLGCPACYRKIKRRAIRDAYKLIGTVAGGKLPPAGTMSCVSINWPVEGLTPDNVLRHQRRFRARLARIWRTELADTVWHFWPDVTLDGKLHVHGFILHPTRTRKELGHVLKRAFPDQCAVDVGWKSNLTTEENLERWSRYVMGADKHVKRRRGRTLVDQDTPALIANRIMMLARMQQNGLHNMRITLGIRGDQTWAMPGFANVVATRRPRKNRPWHTRKHLVMIDGMGNAADENVNQSGVRPCATGSPPEPTRTALA